jgi:putative ABC transport system substrate-binding protein
MASAADPVQLGVIASLAQPGGSVTGLSELTPEMAGKRLELLKETVPNLSHVAVLWDPGNSASTLSWKGAQTVARPLGIRLHSLEKDSFKASPAPALTSPVYRTFTAICLENGLSF